MPEQSSVPPVRTYCARRGLTKRLSTRLTKILLPFVSQYLAQMGIRSFLTFAFVLLAFAVNATKKFEVKFESQDPNAKPKKPSYNIEKVNLKREFATLARQHISNPNRTEFVKFQNLINKVFKSSTLEVGVLGDDSSNNRTVVFKSGAPFRKSCFFHLNLNPIFYSFRIFFWS